MKGPEADKGIVEPGAGMEAPEFWKWFISGRHPEILRIQIATYPDRPHGWIVEANIRELIPAIMGLLPLAEGCWKPKEIVAIGGLVDVCNVSGCGHSPQEHSGVLTYFWEHWHDGLRPAPENPRSLIFLDIEFGSRETVNRLIGALGDEESDWHVLASGGGFHGVVDKLVEIGRLPVETGAILHSIGNKIGDLKLASWGADLAGSDGDRKKVERWCRNVLKVCGHADEPIAAGREVHLVDLRHLGHNLLRWIEMEEKIEAAKKSWWNWWDFSGRAAFLRISSRPPKNPRPPVLAVQKVGGKITQFEWTRPAVESGQMKFKGF